MAKYKITIEFDSDYIPSDIMSELAETCCVQVESLTDSSLENPGYYPYTNAMVTWESDFPGTPTPNPKDLK